MKVRNGYVSNSSSASFVVVLREKDNNLQIKKFLSKEEEKLLYDFGFRYMKGKWQWCIDSCDDINIEDNYDLNDEVCMYMDCLSNEDEIYNFLFKNKIPFKANCSNGCQLWIYDGKSDYYEVFMNYGNLFEMYGNNREMFDKLYMEYTIPYEKVFIKDKTCDSSVGYQIKLLAEKMIKFGSKAKEYFTEEEFKKIWGFINTISKEEIENMKK